MENFRSTRRSVIEDTRKELQDFLAPERREIKARLGGHEQRFDEVMEKFKEIRENLKELRGDIKQLGMKMDGRFEDLRADLCLSQRVEVIEGTLREAAKQ